MQYQWLTSLGTLDIVALISLLLAWLGCGYIIEHPPAGRPSVSIMMKQYRREWMVQLVNREPRIFDSQILSTLREGASFFASACMIAIGGGLALIGNTDRLRSIAEDLAIMPESQILWEIKLILTIILLTSAFLQFVWSLRLFGYCAVIMATVPNVRDHPEIGPRTREAAELNITAARSFNSGLRSVYFALGSLAWLVGPWGLLAGTAFVTTITLRREFASRSRQAVLRALPDQVSDLPTGRDAYPNTHPSEWQDRQG